MVDNLDSIPALVPKLLLQLLETGSITEAASILGVSQPAASKALRRAEQQVGIELLRRDSRPLLLTTEGKLIAEYARQQLQQEETLIQHLRVIKKDGAGLIRIASFGASASTHILPKLIHALGKKHPQIRVEVYEYNDEEALSALREGRVDFAIIVDKERLELDIIPVTTDRLVALVHENDPLAKQSTLSAECILQRDFILTKGGSEALIRDWFSSSGTHLKAKHTAVQLTSIIALIQAGLGVSIVAELAVTAYHPNVKLIPLIPEHPRRICIAKRSGSFSSNAAKCAWKYFETLYT
ncbi:LysR family transcriptional regulator [Vibrio fortis]|uniref:LysR family transcriptional regulator n=1 Tax=Vibrio fortis TaxID=212667 RepID=A0A5N3QT76_9VIBR|nr:LysR family transcriptional regulator [Vibrio fortis]KAB0285387.1 LysR family transcriptional regulator [Vibrio fortis]